MAAGTPQRKVSVRSTGGKQLLGTARQHTLITDRPVTEGGTDAGCTSGEVLLLAIGSCSAGSLRNFFEARGVPWAKLGVEVCFEAHAHSASRERIVITVDNPDAAASGIERAAIAAAATAGAVTSRLALGSEIEVRVLGRPA